MQAEKLERAARESDGRLVLIRTRRDLNRLIADRKAGRRVTGALFSVKGSGTLEGDLDALDRVYRAGMRMASFTHFFDNEVAGSMHGVVCEASLDAVVTAIDDVVDVAGIEAVALGSDFDGSTSVGWGTSELAALTQALVDAGYTDTEVAAITGGNTPRVMRTVLPEQAYSAGPCVTPGGALRAGRYWREGQEICHDTRRHHAHRHSDPRGPGRECDRPLRRRHERPRLSLRGGWPVVATGRRVDPGRPRVRRPPRGSRR